MDINVLLQLIQSAGVPAAIAFVVLFLSHKRELANDKHMEQLEQNYREILQYNSNVIKEMTVALTHLTDKIDSMGGK